MQELKRGYTTGSCATAATRAAVLAVLSGDFPNEVELKLPNGEVLIVPVQDCEKGDGWASCAVKKYSGDDPDVTAGTLIYSKVELIPDDANLPSGAVLLEGDAESANTIQLVGGVGVGKVTKAGLACKVGEPAINPVPREMIFKEVIDVADELDYRGGIRITISIPEGVELAEKTFNPRLGIVGGISVLGTTGRVEPMSETALVATIKAEINVKRAGGQKVAILTPGNYGIAFLKGRMQIPDIATIKISNYVGESLDMVANQGFEFVLLSAHLGKLIKVAGGVMNTHSKHGDRRMEILAGYSRECGVDERIINAIYDCIMVDEAIRLLDETGKRDEVMKAVVEGANRIMRQRLAERGAEPMTAVMTFSNKYGLLATSEDFLKVMAKIEEDMNREDE